MFLKENFTDQLRSYHTFRQNSNRRKQVSSIKTEELYKFYKKNKVSSEEIPRITVTSLFAEFNITVVKRMIFTGYEFNLPSGLGTMSIIKRKRPEIKADEYGNINKRYNYTIDYTATRRLWESDPEAKKNGKKVYIKCEGAYLYMWRWKRGGFLYKNKEVFKFTLSRTIKKMISDAAKNNLCKVNL